MAHTPARERDAWRRAEQLKAAHADAVTRIQSRRDLSRAGRQRQLAAVTVATRQRLAELRAADRETLAEQQQRLISTLFKPSRTAADLLVERNAHEHAANIKTPGDAQAMLRVAQELGDQSLARAVARRCANAYDEAGSGPDAEQWHHVIDTWASTDLAPAYAGDTIAELQQVGAELDDPMTALAASAHYRPDVPTELQGLEHRLDRIAAEADEAGDTVPVTAQQEAWGRFAHSAYNDAGDAA